MRRYKGRLIAEPPSPLRLSEFLPYRLSVAAESVSRAFAARYEAEFGLTIPEWRVMAILGEEAPLPTRAVIARTEMDRVRVSRAVIGLSSKGLVARAAHPEDRRAQVLRLAPKGLALYRRIVPRAHALQAALVDVLSPDELRTLGDLLNRMRLRGATLLGPDQP